MELQVPDVKCTGDFYVELATNSAAENLGIMVHFDSSTPNRHSYMSSNGTIVPLKPVTIKGVQYTQDKINWMIRVQGE